MSKSLVYKALSAFLSLRYRIEVKGIDAVSEKGKSGILFLPNHPALVDPIILVALIKSSFNLRILADKDRINIPVVGALIRKMGAIALPDPAVYGKEATKEIEAAVAHCAERISCGDNLLLYPSGRIASRSSENVGGTSSVETIITNAPNARIVLVRTTGLWGSSFSRAAGRKKVEAVPAILRGLAILMINMLFFTPRRRITIEFFEPENFPKEHGRKTINRYMEAFYNQHATPAAIVPYFFFNRKAVQHIPDEQFEQHHISPSAADVTPALRTLVFDHLKELSGCSTFDEHSSLSRDLGMDSLSIMDLGIWIEKEFAVTVSDPELLQTVHDVLLASTAQLSAASSAPKAPLSWFTGRGDTRVDLPDGATITDVFLKQARRSASLPALTMPDKPVLTYRGIITSILALKAQLEKIEGEYLGLMFPAVSAAPVLYLAALFAGKTPVMINWTTGSRTVRHSLEHLGVRSVITSSAFLSKIEKQGVDCSAFKDRLMYAEDISRRISLPAKLAAAIKARISWRSLYRAKISRHAVVLFTSGSENLPKAVPLTHANILTNIRDVFRSYPLTREDIILGMLPPFHSFGLTCTMIMPLCAGMRAVYHPNPTEGSALAKIIHAFKASMLIGTPTFISGIVRAAAPEDLSSVTRVISGAEKCPEALIETIARQWPMMHILEGYGITECSPIVSANRDANIRFGSIGEIFPSIEYVIVDTERGERSEIGTAGMLLVRGESIFEGYLNYDGASPFVEFEGKLWYKTGDLIREDENGVLTFAGRLKRFIKLGGEMISLPAIEEVLIRTFQNPAEAVSLAVEGIGTEGKEEVVLFSVNPISREEANSAIRDAGFSALHTIRSVKLINDIPLLGSGKTDYRALRSLTA